MAIIRFLFNYDVWLIWAIMIISFFVGKAVAVTLKKHLVERQGGQRGGFLSHLPVIGECIESYKKSGKVSLNRYVLFEIVHTLLWIQLFLVYGPTIWIILGLPAVTVLVSMIYVWSSKDVIPYVLHLLFTTIVILMMSIEMGMPHISMRTTIQEHLIGLSFGLVMYPLFYISNNKRNNRSVFDLMIFSSITGFLFGWLLMFLTIVITFPFYIVLSIVRAFGHSDRNKGHLDFGIALMIVILLFLYVGLDLLAFYYNLI